MAGGHEFERERDGIGTWEKVKDGNRKVVQLHLNLKRLKF